MTPLTARNISRLGHGSESLTLRTSGMIVAECELPTHNNSTERNMSLLSKTNMS